MTINNIKQVLLDTIYRVINHGIELMGKNPNKRLYDVWEDYVRNILEITNEWYKINSFSIMGDYISFKILIIGLSPFEKIKHTIERLIFYYRIIGTHSYL